MQSFRYRNYFCVLFFIAALVISTVTLVSAKVSLPVNAETGANCGLLSLAALMAHTGDMEAAEDVASMSPSNNRGISIAHMQQIAEEKGLLLQGVQWYAHRIDAATLPMIVHLPKSVDKPDDGHYCILEKADADRVVLFDPQIQVRHPIHRNHLSSIWQGIALIADEKLPWGANRLNENECRQTFGGSHTQALTPSGEGDYGQNGDSGPDGNSEDSSRCGTPVWSVNMVNLNLVIQDVPLWYDPPLGPQVQIALTYNSKYPVTGNEPMGQKWTLNYHSYLQEDTGDGTVLVVMPGSRHDLYTPDGNGGYTRGYKVFNQLEKLGTDHFQLTMPDDTVFVYQIPSGSGVATPVLVEWKNALGQALTFGYNSSAQLVTVTDPMNQVTAITYTSGHITRVDDPFGRFAQFEYSASGDLTKITDMGGYWTGLAYDDDGYITELENEKGKTRFYIEPADMVVCNTEYPAPGSAMQKHTRITVTDPEGGTSEYYYNGRTGYGWYVSPRHYMGYVDENNNNFASDVPKIIYNYANTAKGNREEIGTITFQEGTVIGYQYDYDTGMRVSVSDHSGNTMGFTHNDMGRITSIVPPVGLPVTYQYDPANDVDLEQVVRDGLGTRNITYNAYHQVTQFEDEAGHIYGPITYDSFGRVDTITETFDSNSAVTDFNYYEPGTADEYLLKEVRKDGSVIASYTYDTIGRIRTATDATGLTLTYDYNNLNHITRITYPDAKVVEYSYAGCCPRSIESVTDRAGRSTFYTYDKMQRLESVHQPGAGITRYQYDAGGNLTRMVDANDHETRFAYDDEDRLYRKYDAKGRFVEFQYNLDGLLVSRTNARGTVSSFDYDSDHLPIAVTHSDGTPGVSLTYDTHRRLDTLTDALGTRDYLFFDNGLIQSIDGPWADDTITYLWDNLNRIQTVTPQGGRPRNMVYDDQGRLENIVVGTETFTYGYQGVNPLERSLTRPNGSRTNYDYNHLNQLTTIAHEDSSQQLISRFAFQYNDEDLIGNETITQGLGISGFTENLTTYDHNALNQLISTTSPNRLYTYDDDGNMTGGFTPAGHSFTAAYDADNRLKSIEYNDGSALHRFEFVYGYDGFLGRVLQYENTTLVDDLRIVRDGLLANQERNAANTVTREYVWGLNHGGGIGGLLSMRQSGQDYDYLFDGKGNVSALMDGNQAVVAQYAYDTFGNLMTKTGSVVQPFQFSTKRFNEDTGLSYYGYRFYSPSLGRWMNRDPLGEDGGINLFGFVFNNPTNLLDPNGEAIIAPIVTIIIIFEVAVLPMIASYQLMKHNEESSSETCKTDKNSNKPLPKSAILAAEILLNPKPDEETLFYPLDLNIGIRPIGRIRPIGGGYGPRIIPVR